MRQWGAMAAVALAARVMAVPVCGVVKQVDGLPAVGAKVALRPQLQPFVFEDEPATATLTKEGGQFALEAAPGAYQISVDGAAYKTRHLLVVRAGQPVRLRLGVDWPWPRLPVASGVVQVLHADGRPAPVKAVELTAVGHMEPAALDCGC
ncbi:MAG: carboxypeptidase regulatory-like domain-containing protein, partial [Armatimonadetes bacterium]|nr:carboxypeptidase regulatory-like domain-containing protein [Armatimonadota bacterium]